MSSSRLLLPFTLGAITMLVLVIAAGWAVPGMLGRVYVSLLPGESSSGAAVRPADPRTAPSAEPATEPPGAPTVFPGEVPVSGSGEAARLPAQTPSPTALPATGARLLIPVEGVLAASLVDTYEAARGEGRRHDAIDIMAARGTPVLATADGVVMKLFRSELGGTTLYQLAADRRTIYYYAHLDGYAPAMAEGRALRRGEVLGYVGNTGVPGAGNYHLHFEVSTTADPSRYWGGVPQNPYPLLR